MDYERIHKAQTGVISPSRLRMKLIGPHNLKSKDGSKSNSNSSRTSPSKVEDTEFVKNSLLDYDNIDTDTEVSSLEVSSKLSSNSQVDSDNFSSGDYGNTNRIKPQQNYNGDIVSSSSNHPMGTLEDDNLDYDSNASSSSFEFQKEKKSGINPIARSLLRPMSSKWNDAEKWIMNKQNVQANSMKKNNLHSQANRVNKLSVKSVDFVQPESQIAPDRFTFVTKGSEPVRSDEFDRENGLVMDLKEVDSMGVSCTNDSAEDTTGLPAVRAVSMRDMGTEMTPIPSQEPSRTTSPIGTATPISSIQSTPQRLVLTNTPAYNTDNELQNSNQISRKQGSPDQLDVKEKTRREIASLSIQLGKANIATWANKKDDEHNNKNFLESENVVAEIQRVEFEKRAAAWEEAEKCRHNARFKREEIKIQAWESQQKAKLEAEVRRIEAQVEQMRAQAKAKMVKKIAMARQRSEERRAETEARKTSQAEKIAAQAEYIRQTGEIPSSSPCTCCSWLYNR